MNQWSTVFFSEGNLFVKLAATLPFFATCNWPSYSSELAFGKNSTSMKSIQKINDTKKLGKVLQQIVRDLKSLSSPTQS